MKNFLLKSVAVLFALAFLVSCAPEASSQVVDLGIDDFAKTYQETDGQLLDVRTPAEWANGKIASSKLIDFKSPDFAEQIKSLDKSKPVFVYCAVGGRSKKASKILGDAGFKVFNLTNAGYPQVAEKGLK
ncbi:rhodanese-like domain-containing protein [Marinilongibacter aquaticus]|uniref:rhodanese-like domain-containing protein n=1 Tax=Marinilongibacter aquaticus TaxID=2975157 RepID=UPI0021BD89E2|nr:rhodanese-like domain-containing protein [Marinilongibacter aquaticus]UBM57795.1 rhodanese-like domain-containing protein [Marinilongibacter aquaticus]